MQNRTNASALALALASVVSVAGSAAWAQTGSAGANEEIIVTGERVRSLEQFTPTGSRLGLSARETPGTLDVVTSDTMTLRGYATVAAAAISMPGVTTGGSPGNPDTFGMRGFSGNQITILHNGLYIGPSNMTNRPQNTFNLESVEILKGPSSVLYGQGAIGGAINVTNKAPTFGDAQYEAQVTVGSYGFTSVGVGGGGGLTDTLALRADLSRTAGDGFVDRTPFDALNATVSLLWRPSPDLDVQFSIDYGEDNPSNYFGTPLVPASFATHPLNVLTTANGYTIDERMRDVNYNVSDYKIYSHQTWPTLFVRWKPFDGVTIQNYVYYFDAKRRWINAESYVFNPTTEMIDRDRFFVFHEQEFYGDQGSIAFDHSLLGMQNKLVVGFDYSHLDFKRTRGFPDGDSVDPFRPSPGLFGALVTRLSPTYWDDTAIFFEDILNITDSLKLVTGGRHGQLDLTRENYGPDGSFLAGSSFEREFDSSTWRVGLVYDVNEYVTPYVSWTTGEDPVDTNIFIVNAGESFDMSTSRQVEVGVKASTPGGRASMTLAYYDIERDNILTLVGVDTVSNVGAQGSQGFEFTGDLQVTDQWVVRANLAYTDADFDEFVDRNTGLDASGNRPANVSEWIGNVFTSVSEIGGLPLELGGAMRYVGERYGDNANTMLLHDYTLVDLYAAYRLRPDVSLTLRVNNATDEAFVQAADVFYPSQVVLGEPRTFEVSLNARF